MRNTVSLTLQTLVTLLAVVLTVPVSGQTPSQYTFKATGSSDLLKDMNGNAFSYNASTLIGSGKSSTNTALIALPFTFKYMDRTFRYFSCNTNGIAKFDSVSTAAAIGTADLGTNFFSNTAGCYIAPFGLKMNTDNADGGVYSSIAGTAPFRCFVIAWYDMGINFNSNSADGMFELRLYETSNVIEFVYGPMNAAAVSGTAGNIAIGMRTSSTNLLYVNNTATDATATAAGYTGVAFNATNVSNIDNHTYRFSPPVVSLNLTSLGTNSTTDLNVGANVKVAVTQNSTLAGLTVNDLSTLTLTAGVTLTVNGDLNCVSSGVISGNKTASIVISRSGVGSVLKMDQSIPGTSNVLKSLTINSTGGDVTVASDLQVAAAGSVTLTAGQLILADTLWLNSDASGSAMIDAIPAANLGTNFGGTNTIASYSPLALTANGKVVACRYIPSSARRYRFLAPSITGTNFEDLRKEIFVTGPGTGTTVGTLNSNGFDATATNIASIYTFNQATGAWASIANPSTAVVAGQGYRIFVRGDRSSLARLSGTDNTQNAVTINFIGDINKGNITMPVSFTAGKGWNLVSNPYPAGFDWNAFHDAGRTGTGDYSGTNYAHIDATIYIFNAATNSYVSFNALSNVSSDPSFTSGIIPAGASFFVKTVAANPSMTFKETYKTTSSTAPLFFKTTATRNELFVKVASDSVTSDLASITYNSSASKTADDMDIRKLNGTDVNISFFDAADSTLLSASVRPDFEASDVVPVYISSSKMGIHTLTFAGDVFNTYTVTLMDNYMGFRRTITKGSVYKFAIESNPASSAKGRFVLMLTNQASMPVELVAFSAKAQNNDVVVEWSTGSELNNDRFEVEYSTDGIKFAYAGLVKGNGNSNELNRYYFVHAGIFFNTTLYYRLKQVDVDGSVTYSAVASVAAPVAAKVSESYVSVYPKPAIEGVHVKYAQSNATLTIIITDMNGNKVQEVNNSPSYINFLYMNAGAYVMSVVNAGGEVVQTEKIIINR